PGPWSSSRRSEGPLPANQVRRVRRQIAAPSSRRYLPERARPLPALAQSRAHPGLIPIPLLTAALKLAHIAVPRERTYAQVVDRIRRVGRPGLDGLRLQHHPIAGRARQGRLVRGPESVQTARRPGAQPREYREGIRG